MTPWGGIPGDAAACGSPMPFVIVPVPGVCCNASGVTSFSAAPPGRGGPARGAPMAGRSCQARKGGARSCGWTLFGSIRASHEHAESHSTAGKSRGYSAIADGCRSVFANYQKLPCFFTSCGQEGAFTRKKGSRRFMGMTFFRRMTVASASLILGSQGGCFSMTLPHTVGISTYE